MSSTRGTLDGLVPARVHQLMISPRILLIASLTAFTCGTLSAQSISDEQAVSLPTSDYPVHGQPVQISWKVDRGLVTWISSERLYASSITASSSTGTHGYLGRATSLNATDLERTEAGYLAAWSDAVDGSLNTAALDDHGNVTLRSQLTPPYSGSHATAGVQLSRTGRTVFLVHRPNDVNIYISDEKGNLAKKLERVAWNVWHVESIADERGLVLLASKGETVDGREVTRVYACRITTVGDLGAWNLLLTLPRAAAQLHAVANGDEFALTVSGELENGDRLRRFSSDFALLEDSPLLTGQSKGILSGLEVVAGRYVVTYSDAQQHSYVESHGLASSAVDIGKVTVLATAATPSGVMLAIAQDPANPHSGEVLLQHVHTDSGNAEPPFRVAFWPREQTSPHVVSSDGGFILVWSEYSIARRRSEIVARRLGPSGEPSGAEPVIISSNERDALFPSVASNGQKYFVVWNEVQTFGRSAVVGRALTSDLRPGTPQIVFSESSWDTEKPQVAAAGDGFIVVWSQGVTAPANPDASSEVRATFIDDGAAYNGGSVRVSDPTVTSFEAAVSSNGSNVLIAWSTRRQLSLFNFRYNMAAAYADTTLDRITRFSLDVPESYAPVHASVGTNGEDYMLAWAGDFSIFAQRLPGSISAGRRRPVSPNVAPQIEPLVEIPCGSASSLSLAWNGSRYLLGWEQISSSCPASYPSTSIFGVLLSESARPYLGIFEISHSNDLEVTPSVAAANGRFVVSYSRRKSAPGVFGAPRVFTRSIDE
jgi:hypothetical protein